MAKVWVLTREENAYDQYGDYFEACWFYKPSQTAIIQYLVDSRMPTNIKDQAAYRRQQLADSLPELIAEADHILAGGGRRGTEDTWYNLCEESPPKLWRP